MAIDEVFEAKIAPAGATRSRSAQSATSRPGPRTPPRRRGRRRRPRRGRRSGSAAPASRRGPPGRAAPWRPTAPGCPRSGRARRSPARGPARRARRCLPTAAWTWAIPWPMSPAPATNTRSTLIARLPSRRRPAARRRPRTGPARGAATAVDRRVRAGGQRRRREPLPQPLDEDRADLRRGAGLAGRGGGAVSARSPDAARAPRSAPGSRRRSVAVVTSTSGRFGAGRDGSQSLRATVGTSMARSWAAVRCAPGRSPLFTTTMSATSSSPALIACTSSPISGASRTTVVSAAAATSTSLWPGPDRLEQHDVEPRRVEHGRRDRRRRREPAGVPTRRHRADEHPVVVGVGLHADAVAEERPAGDRRRRVHGDDRDRTSGLPHRRDERGHERGLAGAGRSRDPDEVGAAGDRVQAAQRVLGDRGVVLDGGQQAGERAPVAGARGIGQGVGARRRGLGHVPAGPATRAASRCRG